MAELLAAFISGVIFALGLVLGDATNPARVVGFLDVFGAWDATLMFVMAGALITASIGHRFIVKRSRPLFAADFALPWRTSIDGRLVAGAALFGIGWGLGGYCPGPALAFVPAFSGKAFVFLVSMLVGMAAHAALIANRSPNDG